MQYIKQSQAYINRA